MQAEQGQATSNIRKIQYFPASYHCRGYTVNPKREGMIWGVDAVVIDARNEMLFGEVSMPRALYQMVGKRPVIWGYCRGSSVRGGDTTA